MKRFYFSIIPRLCLPVAILASFALQYPSAAQYQPLKQGTNKPLFIPPRIPARAGRIPGRRAGLGSRNNCPRVETQVTALVPIDEQKTASSQGVSTAVFVEGFTTSEHPTLLFYVPYAKNSSSVSTEFVLENKQGKNIYRAEVPLPTKPGIVSVAIPSSVPPLEVGQAYRWYFKVRCNQENTNNPPIYVEGDIQRINLSQSAEQQLLAATNPQEKVSIYATNGVWFDSLSLLAKLRQKYPNNTAIAADWQRLLQEVKLQNIASTSFAN